MIYKCDNRQCILLTVTSWDSDRTLTVQWPVENLGITLTGFGKGNPELLHFQPGDIVRGYPHTYQLDNELDIQESPGINTMSNDHYTKMVIDLGNGRGYNFQITAVINTITGKAQAAELVI